MRVFSGRGTRVYVLMFHIACISACIALIHSSFCAIGVADENFLDPLSQISHNLDTPQHSQGTEESQGASPRPRRSYLPTGKGLESIVSSNSLKIDNSYYPITTPKNEREALASAQKEEWMSAMQAEMHEIWNMNTYTLVPRPENTRIIPSRFVFRIKWKN